MGAGVNGVVMTRDFITQLWTIVSMMECGVSITTSYSKEAGNWDVYVKLPD